MLNYSFFSYTITLFSSCVVMLFPVLRHLIDTEHIIAGEGLLVC